MNAGITIKILNNEMKGPRRDIVLLNAACGIYVGGRASSIEEAIGIADESISSGAAYDKLNEYLESSTTEADL